MMQMPQCSDSSVTGTNVVVAVLWGSVLAGYSTCAPEDISPIQNKWWTN